MIPHPRAVTAPKDLVSIELYQQEMTPTENVAFPSSWFRAWIIKENLMTWPKLTPRAKASGAMR
jgi:hypothetical protein